jgi:glycosyltransferase involved in cell wall biosynthesis
MGVIMIHPAAKNEGIAGYTRYLAGALDRIVSVSQLGLAKELHARYLSELYSPSALSAWKTVYATRPDLVHIQFTSQVYAKAPFLALLCLIRAMRIPMVLTFHESVPERRPYKIRTKYEELVCESVDAIIVHSERAFSRVTGLGISRELVFQLPHGVRQMGGMARTEARRILNLNADPVLLCFGQLSPHKGVEYAIDALLLVLSKFPRARLVIAGGYTRDARGYVSLLRKAASGLADNVSLVGPVPEDLVPLYFRAADLVLLPYSKGVTISGVLHLAIGASVPVITSSVSGLKEIVSQEGIGSLVEPRNSQGLASSIILTLEHKSQYSMYVDNCERLKRQWDWKIVAERHREIYDWLTSR